MKVKNGYYIERLRLINNQVSVLDCDYLLNPPITTITKKDAAQSLYSYIENDLHLDISYGTKEITIETLPEQFQKIFPLEGNSAVFVSSLNYLSDTTLFQLSMSYHRPNQFKFVDFARRQKLSSEV